MRRIVAGLLALVAIAGLSAYFLLIKPEYERLRVVAYDKLASGDLRNSTHLSDTKVYDKNGDQLGIINAGHFTYVSIENISTHLQDAYIAQEDRNFKVHHGVDYKATLRAALKLILNRGAITQGGSTITQQLVKNTYLTSEQTFTRKFVEMMLAREVEKMYTKPEIMELYCNTNFYGNNCYGVEAASRFYFGKSAAQLSTAEAATLAGISNAPSRYEPVKHREACMEKRNQVLQSMLVCGYITEEEYNTFSGTDLTISQSVQEETDESYMTSYALHCAALTLMELNKFPFEYVWTSKDAEDSYQAKYDESYEYYTNLIRGGGYSIYTSLDPAIQDKVQKELDNTLSVFPELQENGKPALQGAAAVVDNRTGYVVAVVGGRGTEDKFNRAYLSVRQPGSAIKPLLDYAPALDSGEYSPATVLDDHKFEGGPANSGGTYQGNVTLREALNRSLNTVAWQILDDIGISYGLDYLAKMHFMGLSWIDSTTKAISIGGFTNGVRVVDMAKGYAALADLGHYSGETCITRILHEKDGDLTRDYKPTGASVYREDTAWLMTDMLKGTITSPVGTGRMLGLAGDMPAAGKTGTTNESKDTWFCGYTWYYTMAVWVGYDTPTPMPGVYGSTYAGKIWQAAMNDLHEGLQPMDWEKADNVEEKVVDEQTGQTDYFSSTAEVRAAASLHEKAEQRKKDRLQALLTLYGSMEIHKAEDVFKARDTYQEAKTLADTLDDSDVRKEALQKLELRKQYFDGVEENMKDSIDRYLTYKEEESSRQQSIDASQAEVDQKEDEKEVNRQSFLSALTQLKDLKYQDGETENLISECIDRLSLCGSYEEALSYAAELESAITRARKLPSESEYRSLEASKEAESSEESRMESIAVEGLQESLSGLGSTPETYTPMRPSEPVPAAGDTTSDGVGPGQ